MIMTRLPFPFRAMARKFQILARIPCFSEPWNVFQDHVIMREKLPCLRDPGKVDMFSSSGHI